MGKQMQVVSQAISSLLGSPASKFVSGLLEGQAAYERQDFVTALEKFKPIALECNADAQR